MANYEKFKKFSQKIGFQSLFLQSNSVKNLAFDIKK